MSNLTLRGTTLNSIDSFRQFKLSNGEEIVCEVVQWGDEEEPILIVRKAMKVYQIDRLDGYRLYTLRPWMIYTEDPQQLMTINDAMIIGECTPAAPLLKQYFFVVKEHAKNFAEEMKEMSKDPPRPFPDNMSDAELGRIVRDLQSDNDDSDKSNVIHWNFDKSKMH